VALYGALCGIQLSFNFINVYRKLVKYLLNVYTNMIVSNKMQRVPSRDITILLSHRNLTLCY